MESSFVGWSFWFLNRAKLVQIVAKHDLKNASFYNNNTATNKNTVIHLSASFKM